MKLSLGEYGRLRTSPKFQDYIKIQRAFADKVKIGSLTQNLSILGKLIFLTQSAARVQLVFAPSLFIFLAQAKTVSQTVLLPKLPSARNNSVSSTFLTAESLSAPCNDLNRLPHFICLASLRSFYVKNMPEQSNFMMSNLI